MIGILQKLSSSLFSKTKVTVKMCGACSYGRDFQFLKQQIWKLDPQIKVQAQKLPQSNNFFQFIKGDGKFEVIVQKQNSQPKLIFDGKQSGRISPFNVVPVLKEIRDW